MGVLIVSSVVGLSLCLLCMLPTSVWIVFQLRAYDQCLGTIEEVTIKNAKVSLHQSTQSNFDLIWADLLSLYENIDVIYRTIRYTEFILFTGEFMHPECSSLVAMKYVPFEYPFYNDMRLLWIRAADEVQELRREIEEVRVVQDYQVMFEKNFDSLVDVYESIMPQFSSLMETVEQLSKMDVSFQNSLHTFPYSWLSSVVPRLDSCFISHIVKEITDCDEDLQTRPIYVLHAVWEEKFQRLQLQQQRAQQRRKNGSIALNAQ